MLNSPCWRVQHGYCSERVVSFEGHMEPLFQIMELKGNILGDTVNLSFFILSPTLNTCNKKSFEDMNSEVFYNM